MTRCIIIDDEPLALEVIETYLHQVKGIELVGKFLDSIEAFAFVQKNEVDVIFLDLNMPLLNGMELLRNLKQRPHVIVTTAYREFAVESFELDVLDYLVKPIAFPRFLKAINKAMVHEAPIEDASVENRTSSDAPVWLKVDKKLIAVDPGEIFYIQSLKDYVRVVTADQKLIVYHTLHSFIDKLPSNEFLRIHKSYVVQVAKIRSIEGNMVHVKNETLPVGRNYRKDLFSVIGMVN